MDFEVDIKWDFTGLTSGSTSSSLKFSDGLRRGLYESGTHISKVKVISS